MMSRALLSRVSASLPAIVCLTWVSAQEETNQLRGWQKLFQSHVQEYAFQTEEPKGASGEARVKLLPNPVLHWSQPVRGGQDGAVYLWTQGGRPFAIGTLFIWPADNGKQGVTHEMQSLSASPFTARFRERRWTPPKDPLVWTTFDAAPAPAASSEQRLRQMRDLAKQFHAESEDKNGKRWDLRLLPRPLYRYDVEDNASDGAIFAFVEGNDVEVLLLLETELTSDRPRWRFALARMSDFRLKAQLGERTVWEVDRSGYDQPRAAYNCSTVEWRRSPDEE